MWKIGRVLFAESVAIFNAVKISREIGSTEFLSISDNSLVVSDRCFSVSLKRAQVFPLAVQPHVRISIDLCAYRTRHQYW
jgi:hypothetical protein